MNTVFAHCRALMALPDEMRSVLRWRTSLTITGAAETALIWVDPDVSIRSFVELATSALTWIARCDSEVDAVDFAVCSPCGDRVRIFRVTVPSDACDQTIIDCPAR